MCWIGGEFGAPEFINAACVTATVAQFEIVVLMGLAKAVERRLGDRVPRGTTDARSIAVLFALLAMAAARCFNMVSARASALQERSRQKRQLSRENQSTQTRAHNSHFEILVEISKK